MHIYWELAEREVEDGKIMQAPIYIAADAGDVEKEVAVRLPKRDRNTPSDDPQSQLG